MKQPNIVAGSQSATAVENEKKSINRELWQTCAGPLVNLPVTGTYVVYFPQGHSEQVAASMKKDVDAQIPNYSNLPPKLLCLLHNVSLHADPETDEVYAQMTLQPVHSFDKDALLRSDISMRANKPQTEFFCKTLTASDTSTHGGFSVPRRAAEKIFPPLDFTMQPPAQELMARDLHDNAWTFRHIYRGQPKRHLLTSGWSLFVNGKRLLAGDSVLFIRDEKQQLLLGIRRANRQPANLSSSVLSSDSMHIGILAAAAHAAANNSPFTVFFNPRTSPSEFVIPLAKYYKTACSNQLSLGMRFRMMFETEESGTRRYMGTITGISDLDPLGWKNSQWRNLQVGWDESTVGEKRNRVSIWEIEPVTAPFFICPTPPFFCSTKRPWQPGMPDDDCSDLDNLFRRTLPWLGDSFGLKESHAPSGFSSIPWMNMQNPSLANSPQPNCTLSNSFLQNLAAPDISRQLTQSFQQNNLQFNAQGPTQSVQQIDQLQKLSSTTFNTLGSVIQSQQPSQVLFQNLQSHNPVQAQNVLQQQQSVLSHQFPKNLSQPSMPHQQILTHHQQQNQMPSHYSDQQLHISDNQTQLQLLQKLQQQHQSLLAQHTTIKQQSEPRQIQNQPNHLLDVPPNFSRFMTPQSHGNTEPPVENKSETSPRFAQQPKLQPPQQTGIPSELPGQMANNNMNRITNQLSVCGDRSAVSDDVPSCSTSPSTNNGPIAVQSSARVVNSSGLETFSCNDNLVKDLLPESQGFFASQPYFNPIGTQIDYLDSSSSATSVLSQNDAHVPQTYNPMSLMFSDASQNREVVGDPRNNIDSQFGMHMIPEPLITKNMVGSSKDFTTNLSSGGDMLPGYENIIEAEHELSSPMVSHSFEVLDMAFHSIDSTINDDSFMNRGAWVPTQIPRLRTYTKVYKRGAVGRSIDITRYSGYDELKQDLARRFGIEGQLEDRHIIGWKLVYVDHENDVLLVGDDPWGEFLSCVKCIKILSPQEVRQMSLDGDIGNSCSLPHQACSTSDNEFMQKMIP